MASQTRINQIKAELQNCGIEPCEQAVNEVLNILSNSKNSVVDAVKLFVQKIQSSQTNTDGLLIDMSVQLSNQQVNFISNTALSLTINRVLNGNFGELNTDTQQRIEDFKNRMSEVKVIDKNFLNSALPNYQTNLLPSSEDNSEERLTQS